MLTVPGNARLFLYKEPMRMHKSFEGLSMIIEQMFPGELLSGAYFIFLNRKKDHMKVLCWDGDGFCIFYKRLEKGVFLQKQNNSSILNRREFFMLFEGITPERLKVRYKHF
jgi:transposase